MTAKVSEASGCFGTDPFHFQLAGSHEFGPAREAPETSRGDLQGLRRDASHDARRVSAGTATKETTGIPHEILARGGCDDVTMMS